MFLRYYFGEDIFISYTRADAITYAAGLASELTRRDFSCFLDQWGTPPGRELPRSLRRALDRSTALVLVGSEGATRSAAVEQEIRTFKKTKRTIIAIDFNGALPRAPWYEEIAGLALTPESTEALASGTPSSAVLTRIEKSFQFTRRNQRARRSLGVASALLGLLALASTYYSRQASLSAGRAREQETVALKNLQLFQEQEQIAVTKAAEAAAKAKEAEQQRAEAEAQAAEAQRQQRLAESRQRLARSRELASNAMAQLDIDPELAMLLAAEAVEVNANVETENALRRSLVESRVRAVAHDTMDGTISPDGRLFVAGYSKGYAGGPQGFDSWLHLTEIASGGTVADVRWPGKSLGRPEFSRDGRLILTVCDGRSACVFDVATGRPIIELVGHEGAIRQARFSDDGKSVVTTSADRSARVWDLSNGRVVAAFTPPDAAPFDSRFSPDGRMVLTSASWQRAYVWEAATGRLIHALPEAQADFPVAAIWLPDGTAVLAMQHGSPTRLWSTSTWTPAREFNAGYVSQAQLSRDGTRLLTVSAGSVQIWNATTGATISRIGQLTIASAAFSPDGELVVTGDSDGLVRVWTSIGTPLATLRGHARPVNDVRFSDDGRWLVTRGDDRTVRVWDSPAPLATAVIAGHGEKVWNAVFSPNGQIVATATQKDTFLADARSGRHLHRLKQSSSIVPGPVFSPDSRVLVTVGDRNVVQAWDVASSREMARLTAHRNGVLRVALTPDGRLAVTVDLNGGAIVWETATGKVRFEPGNPAAVKGARQQVSTKTIVSADGRYETTDVQGAAFSRDGTRLVTRHGDWNGTLRVWDVAAGRDVATMTGVRGGLERIDVSPDGRLLLTGSEGNTLQIWELATRRKVADLRVTGAIEEAFFSDDGRWIVTRSEVGNTRELRQWDVATQRSFVLASFQGSASAFSSNGRFAIRSGLGNAMEVWEPATGVQLAVLRGHTDRVGVAAFSADGRSIVTAGDDGTARIYECALCGSVQSLVTMARQRAQMTGRRFTPAEQFKFFAADAPHVSAPAASPAPPRRP
jgi:WD40 repeat protein